MSEPTTPVLVVHPEVVGRRMGLALPLAEDDLWAVEEAILDAQAAVQGYLRQPLTPTSVTLYGQWPGPYGWEVPDPDATEIVATPEMAAGSPTGLYTLTYLTGLDVANDPALEPIRRFIIAHAMNTPEMLRRWQAVTGVKGDVRSVSTDGQAISYGAVTQGGGGTAGSGAPGALPTLRSLSRWRRRSAFQRRGQLTTAGPRPWWW